MADRPADGAASPHEAEAIARTIFERFRAADQRRMAWEEIPEENRKYWRGHADAVLSAANLVRVSSLRAVERERDEARAKALADAAKVCRSRAASLAAGGMAKAALEADKCARSIEILDTPCALAEAVRTLSPGAATTAQDLQPE